MADETKRYQIVYVVDPSKALKGLAEIDAALLKTQAGITKTAGMLKSLGQNTPGIPKTVAELKKLDVELKSKVADSRAAENALKKVGTGNSAVTSLTKRLAELENQLQAVTTAAGTAGTATAGVGAGGSAPAPGGGAGGKPAGGGKKSGFGRAAAYTAAGIALAVGRKVTQAGASGWEGQRSFYAEAADKTAAFRQDLRQLSNLQNKPHVDDALVKEQLEFQMTTGLNADEAMQFRLEFGGAIAPGLARQNIDKTTAGDLEKQAAKFGLLHDLDMQTSGRMAGLMANYQKVPTASSGLGVMAESMKQLDKYGVGPVPGMMPHMLGMAGSMLDEEGGRFRDFQSMSARFAATTVSTAGKADMAANQMRQTNRALRKFGLDNSQGEFLRKARVNENDTYEQALAKVAPLIAGPNGDQVLLQAGFGNEREREGLIKQSKMTSVVEEQLKDPEMAQAREAAAAENDKLDRTPLGMQRRAENSLFKSEILTGEEGLRLKLGREAARSRMANPNQPGGQRLKPGFWGGVGDAFKSSMTLGAVSGEDIRTDVEAIQGVIEGGRQVGIDIKKQFPGLYYSTDAQRVQHEYSRAYEAVQGAGGDPFGGPPLDAAKAAKKAGAALNQLGDALSRPGDQGGRPTPPPVGNGGAGVNPRRP